LKDVYDDVASGSGGVFSTNELKIGLERCGESCWDQCVLQKIFQRVAGDANTMQFNMFSGCVLRLRLVHLLFHSAMEQLRTAVFDYNSQFVRGCRYVPGLEFNRFIFRPCVAHASNRWVHIHTGNTLQEGVFSFLAVAVKHGLHQLATEDVIEQRQTTLERYDSAFFIAMNHITLSDAELLSFSSASLRPSPPKQICGRHIALFCDPRFETMLTISQTDTSFGDEWTLAPAYSGQKNFDSWAQKLENALGATCSRLRERGVNFLLYQILDHMADDLGNVTHAYTVWLASLRGQLHKHETRFMENEDWLALVSRAHLQLDVILRRIKHLRRVLAEIRMEKELDELKGYWQDVGDHIEEALESGVQVKLWCAELLDWYKQVIRGRQELRAAKSTEWRNTTLFVLCVATAIFAPAQFFAGIFGMNFENFPGLDYPHAYQIFQFAVVVYFFVASIITALIYRRLKKSLRNQFPKSDLIDDELEHIPGPFMVPPTSSN